MNTESNTPNKNKHASKGETTRRTSRSWIIWIPINAIFISYFFFGSSDKDFIEISGYYGLAIIIGAILMLCWFITGMSFQQLPIAAAMIISGPVIASYLMDYKSSRHLVRAAQADRMVEELCEKDGGTKIYRTVEGVEGVRLLSLVPEAGTQKSSQFEYPYPWYHYIQVWEKYENLISTNQHGYLFVEYTASTDGQEQRLRTTFLDTGQIAPSKDPNSPNIARPLLERDTVEIQSFTARYGWKVYDLTSDNMRKHWISGGRVEVLDIHTNEILGEMTGYYRGYGRGKHPWEADNKAKAECSIQSNLEDFLNRVLVPSKIFPSKEKLRSLME